MGDPILESNLTRRVDFALFMVAALEMDELVQEAPAIVGCKTPSALAHRNPQLPELSRDPVRGARWNLARQPSTASICSYCSRVMSPAA